MLAAFFFAFLQKPSKQIASVQISPPNGCIRRWLHEINPPAARLFPPEPAPAPAAQHSHTSSMFCICANCLSTPRLAATPDLWFIYLKSFNKKFF